MRSHIARTLLVVLALAIPGSAVAENITSADTDVIVAVIDSGIRPTHQEFLYGGPSSTTDQFVGWWDFTDSMGPTHKPGPGETWDPYVPTPYDDIGHGTGTASLAVGRNIGTVSQKDRSFAPGFKLAVARVCKAGGVLGSTCSGDMGAAISWAVENVGADVITISIGSAAAGPPALSAGDAFKRARDAGVMVTVSNGNGNANAGVPGDIGWFSNYGNSTSVLSIGVAETTSTFSSLTATTDAEVTAKANSARLATRGCDTCYGSSSGTSFSNPLVAGMAAKAMKLARDNAHDASPEYIERLLKYSAADTAVPPQFEGYGRLDAAQFNGLVVPHATAGTLPARPSPDLAALYVEEVGLRMKGLWSNGGGGLVYGFLPTEAPAQAGPGAIGPSSENLMEVEVYRVFLAAGETMTADLTYGAPDPDFAAQHDVHLAVYAGKTAPFLRTDLWGASKNGPGAAEQVTLTAPTPGWYSVLAYGQRILRAQPISVTTSSDNASTPEASFASERYYTLSYGAP